MSRFIHSYKWHGEKALLPPMFVLRINNGRRLLQYTVRFLENLTAFSRLDTRKAAIFISLLGKCSSLKRQPGQFVLQSLNYVRPCKKLCKHM